jgi:nucleotide-binding universal stress UspA family protein
MKKILVPTDFSECSKYAVDLAIEIARSKSSEIHFLHVVSVPIDWVKLVDERAKLYTDVNKKINKVNKYLDGLMELADGEGIQAMKFIGYDDSFNSVIDHINTHDIDMVVMGSHGKKGMTELFMGTHAQRIARMSKAPVLIVKSPMTGFDLNKILFASSYDEELMPAFRNVLNFAEVMDAKIDMVFVNTPYNFTDSESIEKKMEKYIEINPDIINEARVCNCYNIDEGLIGYCDKNNCDLIVMITHGRTGFSRIFNGSVTETVINHSEFPVLSINAN